MTIYNFSKLNILVFIILILSSCTSIIESKNNYSCKNEKLAFTLFRFIEWISPIFFLEDPKFYIHKEQEILTNDGIILRGGIYQPIPNHDLNEILIILPGNAIPAKTVANWWASYGSVKKKFMKISYFDYRGYGKSEGLPSLISLVDDSFDIINYHLEKYERVYLYGHSFGGILVSQNTVKVSKAVIDSTPSKISEPPFNCPKEYDPVVNLPLDTSNVMIISGKNDTTVTTEGARKLIELVGQRGGTTYIDAGNHPGSYESAFNRIDVSWKFFQTKD